MTTKPNNIDSNQNDDKKNVGKKHGQEQNGMTEKQKQHNAPLFR